MNAIGYGLIVLLVVGAVGTYAYLPLPAQVSKSATSATTTTSTAVTSCSSRTYGQPASSTINGTYTTSQSAQVRVDYVRALVYTDQTGQSTLRFQVGFTNVGASDIYVAAGCGSSLSSTIKSGAGVVRTVEGSPRCLCAEYLSSVPVGQSQVAVDPGCWSGYSYQVVEGGQISAKLTLSWYGSTQYGSQGQVTITANFNIPQG